MSVTPEQMFLLATMKDMGIDRETTCTVVGHLKTSECIRSMWYWLKTIESTPSNEEIMDKLVEFIDDF